ncbi:MAG: tRNA (adenosine(37)-N6)-threonylcarbamoyltransferase complex dimerization subunit type 1 TsaB [Spirochaetota bacterium]
MNHLAIDTATEILSVALRVGSEVGPPESDRARHHRDYVAVRDVGLKHTERLLPIVDALLSEAGIAARQLDLVSCTRGPGSFTGLRIGMATAKGLAAAVAGAHDLERLPLVSVSTLDAMARRIPEVGTIVLPVIDGKKGRFYGAAYFGGTRRTTDLDLPVDQLLSRARESVPEATRVIVTGPHAAAFAERAGSNDMVVDPACRCGWAHVLLNEALLRLERDGFDSDGQGPDYARGSDAEPARSTP